MVARIVSEQRRKQFQRRQAARKRVRSGIKNIVGRVRNKTFKIKQLIAVPKNIQKKKWPSHLKNDSAWERNISCRKQTCRISIINQVTRMFLIFDKFSSKFT